MKPTANHVEFESGRSFAQQIREQPRNRETSAAVLNQFDQISKDDAIEMLRGGMTEKEARAVMTDSRMSKWMSENNVKFDAETMDRMIHNRLVPNVRKITQNATGHGSTLARHIGADITFQPKRAVEQDDFSTPEERRLPWMVAHSGKGSLPTAALKTDYYADKIGNNLNGVNPIKQVIVGRGISVDGSSSMNLHYGSVRPELPDPGQMRNVAVHEDVDLVNPDQTRPTAQQIFDFPQPDVVMTESKDERIETSNIQKFTSVDQVEVRRNLRDLLKSSIFEVERTPYENLMHDANVFETVLPNPDFKASKDTVATQDVANKTLENRENHGRTLRAAMEWLDAEKVERPPNDPARSEHSILIQSEKRYAPAVGQVRSEKTTLDRKVDSVASEHKVKGGVIYRSLATALREVEQATFKTTHDGREQLDGPLAILPSNGGGEEKIGSMTGEITKVERGVRGENLHNPSAKNYARSDARTFGETTLFVQDRAESTYRAPGSILKKDASAARPGENANQKHNYRVQIQEAMRPASLATSDGRPKTSEETFFTTRKLGGPTQPDEPPAVINVVVSERNKAMRGTNNFSSTTTVGENTTTGRRKAETREIKLVPEAHAPNSTALGKKVMII